MNWATANGTATAPSDFVNASGILRFSPGVLALTITNQINGDLLFESDETFIVQLSGAVNGSLAMAQGVVRILNDDTPPAISIGDVRVVEGNVGTRSAVQAVTLSRASGLPVTMQWATANGTAISGSDYVSGLGMITFPPGSTSQFITNQVNGDLLDELDETFVVNLAAPTGGTIAKAQGTATITDDDAAPALSVTDVSLIEGNSGSTEAVSVVTLSSVSSRPVTGMWTTVDGTATAPNDYVANSGTLTFLPGTTRQTITNVVNGDLVYEPSETLGVVLSGEQNATLVKAQGTVTIRNDDALPTLSISGVTVVEGDSGTADAIFEVQVQGESALPIAVDYATAEDSALVSTDYLTTTGTLEFSPGGQGTSTAPIRSATTPALAIKRVAGSLVLTWNAGNLVRVEESDSLNGHWQPVARQPALGVSQYTVTASTTDHAHFYRLIALEQGSANIQQIRVRIVGDLLAEDVERFFVRLTNPRGATIAVSEAIGTIQDNDVPTIVIGDVSVQEGDSGAADALLKVSLSTPSTKTISVKWATADGSATAPADYSSGSSALTFSPGITSQFITIKVKGELLSETDETFQVVLSAPVNATIADPQGVVTIINDDSAPVLRVDDIRVVEGNSGTVEAVQTVSLSGPSALPISVKWTTGDGSATAPGDYQAANGTLAFAPGAVTQIIRTTVAGDLLNEPDEAYSVILSAPVNATLQKSVGTITIVNDDGAPTLSIGDVTVLEGNSGTASIVQTVTLSTASAQTINVAWATGDGSAVAPADYVASNGTLTFAPGEVVKTITNQIVGDLVHELDEKFTVALTAPANAAIGKGQGTVTIQNDDALPSVAIASVSVAEGDVGTTEAVFNVQLTGRSALPVTFSYATADGSALAGVDYGVASGTLTFAPSALSSATQEIRVAITGDRIAEADETFLLRLSNVAGGVLAASEATGTIVDNDQSIVSIADVTVTEGDSGSTDAVFTLKLSTPNSRSVSVTFGTVDESASVTSDYGTAAGTATFSPGETSKPVVVKVLGDLAAEANETFLLKLSNPVNATLARASAQATILDNDASVIRATDLTVTEGDAGTSDAAVIVTLSNPNSRAVSVTFATQDDTAKAGQDYSSTASAVTFAPGETTKSIVLKVLGDTVVESTEKFRLKFSAPVNATLGVAEVLVTILDTDKQAVPPAIRLTSPGNGDIFPVDAAIILSAAVTQGSSPIAKVEFFADGQSIGTATETPYAFTWEGAVVGAHILKAAVTDRANQAAESASVSIEVIIPDTRTKVAIVQNFADAEISSLQAWLTDLDLSVRVFNQEGLTREALRNYELVIWNDLGATAGGLTDNDVQIFSELNEAGIPLYYIGNKLGTSSANLTPAAAQTWSSLTHLHLVGTSLPSDNHVSSFGDLHPVNNGPFGFIGSFNVQVALENALATVTGEQVVMSADNAHAVLAFEDPNTLTRTISQNFLALNNGGVNAAVQREKLFKNAVWWLLRFPGVPPFMNARVSVEGSPVEMRVGQEVALKVTIQHTGEIPATGVILTVVLPPNLSFVSATAENGNCIAEDQYIICFLPNLERVDSATANITVRANAPGGAEIIGGVSENQAEAILDDNYFQTNIEIIR